MDCIPANGNRRSASARDSTERPQPTSIPPHAIEKIYGFPMNLPPIAQERGIEMQINFQIKVFEIGGARMVQYFFIFGLIAMNQIFRTVIR
jgi:hypothetical protein